MSSSQDVFSNKSLDLRLALFHKILNRYMTKIRNKGQV